MASQGGGNVLKSLFLLPFVVFVWSIKNGTSAFIHEAAELMLPWGKGAEGRGSEWKTFPSTDWIHTTNLRNNHFTLGDRKLHLCVVRIPAEESMICL